MTEETIHAIAECVQKMLSVSAWRFCVLSAVAIGAEVAFAVHGSVPDIIRLMVR